MTQNLTQRPADDRPRLPQSQRARTRHPARRQRRRPVRDGTTLLADVHRPDADGRFPALIAASPYPRQIQDLGARWASSRRASRDFWVPRGYVHVIANVRGTGGSGGTFGFFDAPGTPGHVRPRRVGRRAAVVRRQRRHDRHQLLRHDPTRGRRRAAAAPQGDLPGGGHRRPVRGGHAPRAGQLVVRHAVPVDDRTDGRAQRRVLAQPAARTRSQGAARSTAAPQVRHDERRGGASR